MKSVISQSPRTGVRSMIGRRALPVVGLAAVLFGLASINQSSPAGTQKGDDEIAVGPARQDVEEFMARKLKAAQLTLEGVMTNRFQQVQDNADLLVDLSRHAAWKQLASPSYIQDTADFVAAAEYLNQRATAEDTEGTIMAFNRLTACCANCHQHVRTPRVASLELPSREHRLSRVSR